MFIREAWRGGAPHQAPDPRPFQAVGLMSVTPPGPVAPVVRRIALESAEPGRHQKWAAPPLGGHARGERATRK